MVEQQADRILTLPVHQYLTKTDLENGILKTYNYIKRRGSKPFKYHINIEIKNELTPEVWTKKGI